MPRAFGEPAVAPVALELFTSQGCSSCPPADRHLGELSQRADIVALSYHVDYWDYLGWKDRFATRETTERQRIYARVLKQRYVYTPEMVIDGLANEPGVNKTSLSERLAEAHRRLAQRATPQIARTPGGALTVSLAPFKLEQPADIVLAVYDRRHATPVHEGENDGRTLENFNVVRRFEMMERWNGSEAHWTVPPDRFKPEQGVAILVQQPEQGAILGCNKYEPMTAG
ncbi:MAG: DUF1223 domain-containing protein [Alphaproteobacteria bacterium]|nr:DUF1223 domain-containing protein [Alphaproteobacteria bacterium]